MMWRDRIKAAEKAARKAGRQLTERAQKVGAQGLAHAKLAGARLARKVTAIQQAAGPNRQLAERSLRTMQDRTLNRASDRAFREAYVQVAAARLALSGPPPHPRRHASPSASRWKYPGSRSPRRNRRDHGNGKPDEQAHAKPSRHPVHARTQHGQAEPGGHPLPHIDPAAASMQARNR